METGQTGQAGVLVQWHVDRVNITELGHAQNHHLHMVENSVLVTLTKLMIVPLALDVQVQVRITFHIQFS